MNGIPEEGGNDSQRLDRRNWSPDSCYLTGWLSSVAP